MRKTPRTSVGRLRALDESEKQERRTAILEVVANLCAAQEFADITMSIVAERAALAKGTLYLYFPSKESLFLGLLIREFSKWSDLVDEEMAKRPAQVDAFASVLAQALAARPLVPRLLSLTHPVLEKNVDAETVLAFKRELLAHSQRLAIHLEKVLGTQDDPMPILLGIHAIVIGAWNTCAMSPDLRRILSEGGMDMFLADCEPMTAALLAAYLRGISSPN